MSRELSKYFRNDEVRKENEKISIPNLCANELLVYHKRDVYKGEY